MIYRPPQELEVAISLSKTKRRSDQYVEEDCINGSSMCGSYDSCR
jgi:hypothetical protein